MISRISYFALICLLLSGCVHINKQPYKYTSPLKLSSGCPSIAGTYYIDAGKSLEPGSGYLLGSYAVVRSFAARNWVMEEKWLEYFKGKPSNYDIPIEMKIAGDSNSILSISVFGGEEHQPIFNMKLSQLAGDYSCLSGYILFKKSSQDVYSHECCSGSNSKEVALTSAQDGALVARVDNSYSGIVLVAPSYQTTQSWYVIKRKKP